jgi:probable HAF family extracellular repeat protein
LKLSYINAKGFGLALLAGFAVNGGAQTYTAIDLGTVSPNSINNALQVAGNNFTTGNAFLYTNGTQVNLGSLAGAGSSAASVNINGQVTGNSRSTPTNGALPHTFLYIGGVMTDLGTLPGGSESQGNSINSSGQITGWSQTGVGKPTLAFIWSNGTYTNLGPVPGGSDSQGMAINDSGEVVGRAFSAGGAAYIYSNGSWTSIGILPGFTSSTPTGINNSGQVSGFSQSATGETHGFFYSAGVLKDLGTLPGGSFSAATGLNKSGEVVGYSSVTGSLFHAFTYSNGTLTDLNNEAAGLPANVYLNYANAINDFGQIVATASNGHGYLLVTSTGSTPFGNVDTPVTNTTGVAGAVSVTGWALSGAGVETVAVWRNPVPGEAVAGNGLVFIQNATVVVGSRPDVAMAHPGYPCGNCGWGTQVLTNEIPNSSGSGGLGNGTYTFHVLVTSYAGQVTDIGTTTITVNNVASKLPFGTIDTPIDGATVSGTIVNFGWALTPEPNMIPIDGSTIRVFIDNLPVGNPVYNNYRADIATLFPDYANSDGAIGYYYLNTTTLTNGLHTISWVVRDNAGNAQGIGSRFFNVLNVN